MRSDHPGDYGDTFAQVYDDWYIDISDVEATVRALCSIVHDGAVLELGVGTGRLALPLVEAGRAVVGVDASREMLQKCAAKPGGARLQLVLADMASLPLRGGFAGVFVAFNTLFNLTTECAQRRCVREVARLLRPGDSEASFLVEAFVPSREPSDPEYHETSRPDHAGGRVLTTSLRSPEDQTVRGVHIHTPEAGGVRRLPWAIRYLHPNQLDAICLDAGLRLADRWADWDGTRFDLDRHDRHVSRYVPAGPTDSRA